MLADVSTEAVSCTKCANFLTECINLLPPVPRKGLTRARRSLSPLAKQLARTALSKTKQKKGFPSEKCKCFSAMHLISGAAAHELRYGSEFNSA